MKNTSRSLKEKTFFAAIRIVVWQFLYFSRATGELSPDYLECPTVCPAKDLKMLSEPCGDCPRRELFEEFRADSIEFLEQRAPGWGKWGFDELYSQALDIFDFEQIAPEKQTITTAALVAILESEREKMRRVDSWNDKQSSGK